MDDWSAKLRGLLKGTPDFEAPARAEGVSAVMALIGYHAENKRDEILLMKRTHLVETHKGQISFPGGFKDEDDPGILETALRETEEELGIQRKDIEVLGALAPVWTRGNVVISPWVGIMKLPYHFVPNPTEVDRVLFLSLERLLAEGLQPVDVRLGEDLVVKSQGITVDGELVWGATAEMLSRLRKLILDNQ